MQVTIDYFDGDQYPWGKSDATWFCRVECDPVFGGSCLFNSPTKPTVRQVRKWKKRAKAKVDSFIADSYDSYNGDQSDTSDETYAIQV